MSLYSNVEDVRNEFKTLSKEGKNIITTSRILEYLGQANSLINSKIGTRYVTPVTGQKPVDQIDNISVDTVTDSINYVLTIEIEAYKREYIFTSGISATDQEIVDGLEALINKDDDRIIEVQSKTTASFKIKSKVMGLEYSAVVSAEMTLTNDTEAISGSNDLRLLRTIESGMAACKIAGIIRVKVAAALTDSKVRQDIKDGSCQAAFVKILNEIQKNQIDLEDAELNSEGGGLASFTQKNNVPKLFKRFVDQW